MIEMSMLTYIRTKILSPFPNNSLKCRHLQALKNDFGENKSAPDLLAAVSRPAIQHHLMYLPPSRMGLERQGGGKTPSRFKGKKQHFRIFNVTIEFTQTDGLFFYIELDFGKRQGEAIP